MSVTEESLVEGNYYIHLDHGICRYVQIRYVEDKNENKKYYSFQFRGNDSLYVPSELLTRIIECDLEYARKKGLTRLGTNSWIKEKTVNEHGAFVKTKESLIQIEAYRNVLLDGIENINSLIEQTGNHKDMFKSLAEKVISALNDSVYPKDEGFIKEIQAEIEENTSTMITNYRLPTTTELPNTVSFKLDATLDNLTEVKMKEKEFIAFYDSVIFQITLRTIFEIFQVTEPNEVDSVVFNGWVDNIDKKTGNSFTACIISVMVSREQFENINLELVSPRDCVVYLKGIFSGRLHELAPIKPILEFNRNDKRFVESVEILHELHEGVNLAEMDWEDFEYLVRELFGKMFSKDGSEVRVTRASRDGGVDAVAFDTDPIRGGKFIIQAKRYNNVVPVSAVRDLYGTVINEGAIKGILVTTSYFGNDSREFSKDKPITLMDGSHLVYLLNEYGYKSHIKLREKL